MDIKYFLVFVLLFMGACKKDTGSGTNQQSLKAFFSGSARYTLFNKALVRTRLDSLLGGTNPYTVFAISDSAMSQAGYTAAGIDTTDIATLTGILRYHIVPGAIASTDVQLYIATILTTADSSIPAYLEYNNFGLFYNGIPLVSVDTRLGNGVVHSIATAARPPLGDAITTIARTPSLSDFSYLVTNAENVVNAGGSFIPIIPYVSGTASAPLTLFIPDNKFYASMGLDSYSALQQVSGPGTSAYYAPGLLFTSDFMGENIVNASTGSGGGYPLWFSNDGNSFIQPSVNPVTGTQFSQRYKIVQANIITTSGIIHIIEPYNQQ